MHNRSIPMLEYLDPDYDRELASAPQGGQVAVNEAMTSLRYTFGQLPYRGVRNIEAHQVETGVHQRDIVPAVTAPDVEALSPDKTLTLGGRHDVSDEFHRCGVPVAASRVLCIPRSNDSLVHSPPIPPHPDGERLALHES
jgi:hypothetical protein